MNPRVLPLLAGALLACPAHALTLDDIAPAALPGKTLTFTITSATGGVIKSGSWTGKFETSPSGTLTIANVSGNMENTSTSYSANSSGETTSLQLSRLFTGSGITIVTLGVTDGIGTYAAASTAIDPGTFPPTITSSFQGGTFTINGTATPKPEIAVTQTTSLTDGKATVNLGNLKVGKSGAKTFTIRNLGSASLTGLSISRNGKHAADFKVTKPKAATLAPGASTTFKVTFRPKAKGKRSAAIHIRSNDADESPFDIKLAGKGVK